MSDITLSSTDRQTLLSLQQVTTLFNTTQNRLNSGNKVNSSTDNPVAFFRAQSLTDRASDILNRKSGIDQSVQAVQSALTATSAVTKLLQQLQGVLDGAKGGSLNQRIAASAQFSAIGQQLAQLVQDTSFQGLNILNSTSAELSTQFSERTAATFTIQGYDLIATATANGKTLFTQAVAFRPNGSLIFSHLVGNNNLTTEVLGFSQLDTSGTAAGQGTVPASVANAIFAATDNRISNAINQLRGITAALGTNVSILQARSNFSATYSNSLQTGAGDLTLADLNTEAANSQALQLRQQFGIQSLVSANTQQQSVLTLLKG
ncbi:MAG TPA: flagellin [Aliidongia sp.]|nr:flagellin [Aliidongia sp.]